MALTSAQLEEIKIKVETDKVRPMKAIKDLHPDGKLGEIRKQLFETYPRQELLTHFVPANKQNLTKEQKIAKLNQQLENMEQRKVRLQQEKGKLESE